ncbi:MAG TPA: hypothetical protein GXZ51_02020 [Acholeplasma sp.]|nr:hypothetical protein [Acholeplasma sp.]
MEIRGRVVDTIPSLRIIKAETRDRMYYVYLSRKMFRDFGPYFYETPYVLMEVDKKETHGKYSCYHLKAFTKIIKHIQRERRVFFDILEIQDSIRDIINRKENMLFIDLEYSLPSSRGYREKFIEIIQYGMVLYDKEGKKILEDHSLVKPNKKSSLNKNTLNFISREFKEFKDGVDYIVFYQTLEEILEKYDPKIVVWGNNDVPTLEKSFRINHLKPLKIRKRSLNLMQLIKNYYSLKNDLGLFETYELATNTKLEPQMHDAFEDAVVLKGLYDQFKKDINKKRI